MKPFFCGVQFPPSVFLWALLPPSSFLLSVRFSFPCPSFSSFLPFLYLYFTCLAFTSFSADLLSFSYFLIQVLHAYLSPLTFSLLSSLSILTCHTFFYLHSYLNPPLTHSLPFIFSIPTQFLPLLYLNPFHRNITFPEP